MTTNLLIPETTFKSTWECELDCHDHTLSNLTQSTTVPISKAFSSDYCLKGQKKRLIY